MLYGGGISNDTLDGGTGNDVLQGDDGADTLYGGDRIDLFRYAAPSDSLVAIDTIMDFDPGSGERIDLSSIDAVAGGADTPFTFIGNAAFTHSAGELCYDSSYYDTTWVYADVNGDGLSDLSIALAGNYTLVAGNFVL